MEEIECRMRGRKTFLPTGIMAGKVGVTGESDDVLSSAKGPELPKYIFHTIGLRIVQKLTYGRRFPELEVIVIRNSRMCGCPRKTLRRCDLNTRRLALFDVSSRLILTNITVHLDVAIRRLRDSGETR